MFKQAELFGQALGLQEPWQVEKTVFDADSGKLDIYLTWQLMSKFPCPKCQKICTVHDSKERTWRHLNFFQFKAYIHICVPRIKCTEHKVRQVGVPWARAGSGFTLLFDALLMQLMTVMPVKSVANIVGEHDTRLWRVLNHYVSEARKKENFSTVKNIGMDETSSKKGHNYVSIFADLDESKILFATEGKNADTVKAFVNDLKAHNGNAEQIENVSCDMSNSFIKGTEENLKNAKITFDKFHVMKMVNEALDKVRKMEQANNEVLKNSRYAWLKNPENRTKTQNEIFSSLSKMNLDTVRAYNIKISIQGFWQISDPEIAEQYLNKWYFWATHSRLEPIKELAYSIKRHWNGILQYTKSGINNGILEGMNSLIQATKRKARGYRNTDNLINVIYLTLSRLHFDLPKAYV